MPYVTEHMADAEWSLGLIAETPRTVLDSIGLADHAFSHIVITGTDVDPADFGPDMIDDDARQILFAGRIMEQTADGLTMSGDSPVGWLGDDNDGGDMYVGADSSSSALALAAQVTGRVGNFDNGIHVGTDGDTTATRTIKTLPGTSRRQFLDMIIALYPGGPWEWAESYSSAGYRVVVGNRGVLFPTVDQPTVILARNGGYGAVSAATAYLSCDGTGDYATTVDTGVLDILGDIDIRVKVRATDYTPAAAESLVAKYYTTGNQRSYWLRNNADGTLELLWSTAGTGATVLSEVSTNPGLTNGTDYWIRATLDVNDGAGNRVTKFYTSTDTTNNHESVTWSLFDTNTTAGTTSIYASTAPLEIGAREVASGFAGRVYAAAVLDGIDDEGTVVADPDFTTVPSAASGLTDPAGRVWTFAGNAVIVGSQPSSVTGLPADFEVTSRDVWDYRTAITAGDPNTAVVGAATNTPPSGWVNFSGAAMVLRSFLSTSPRKDFVDRPRKWGVRIGANKFAAWILNSASQATRTATNVAERVNTYAITVTANVDVPAAGRHLQVGDGVYVWDPGKVVDLTYEVHYRGEPAHPMKLRVQRADHPITRGMGVFARVWDGAAFDYIRLTPYVAWEEGPSVIELGTKKRQHTSKSRPVPLNRRRIRALSRVHYRLSRFFGTSP